MCEKNIVQGGSNLPVRLEIMGKDRYNHDEKLNLDKEPEEGLAAIFEGASVEEAQPDIISDPGVEGGVDAPNEEPKENEPEA